jgi:hypothetical protein
METFELYPLALTSPNWETFCSKVQKVTGVSPTDGLTGTVLDLDVPASYLASLDLSNQPLQHLREGVTTNDTFEHFSVSFLLISNYKYYQALIMNHPGFHIKSERFDDIWISILTANMATWYRCVNKMLIENRPKIIRQIFHQIFYHFEQLGFKEIWYKYDRQLLKDKTMILIRR